MKSILLVFIIVSFVSCKNETKETSIYSKLRLIDGPIETHINGYEEKTEHKDEEVNNKDK